MEIKAVALVLAWSVIGTSNYSSTQESLLVTQQLSVVDNNVETTKSSMYVAKTNLGIEIEEACITIGEEYDISAELLMAIIEKESGGDPYAVNKKSGCMGLMQLHPKYANYYMGKAGVSNPYSINDNIRAGCEILREKFEKYEDLPLVLMLYHGESGAQKKYQRGQTSKYAQDIIDRTYELERM